MATSELLFYITVKTSMSTSTYTHGRIFDVEEGLKVSEEIGIYAGQRLENGHAR